PNLVGSKSDRSIRQDPAQLLVDLHDRNPRSQSQRKQPPHRLRIRHRRTTRLAERDEHLERLTLLVLGDVHEHHAERRLLSYSSPTQLVRPRTLRAALEVLRLGLVERFLQALDLRFLLGDRRAEVGDERAVAGFLFCGSRRRGTAFARLCGTFRRTGREDLVVAAPVAIDGDALAVAVASELVETPAVFDV